MKCMLKHYMLCLYLFKSILFNVNVFFTANGIQQKTWIILHTTKTIVIWNHILLVFNTCIATVLITSMRVFK